MSRDESASVAPGGTIPLSRERRGRGAARWRWSIAIAVALGFHIVLAGLARVQLDPRQRQDVLDPQISWVGDRVLLAEDTPQGQQLKLFDDTPLFLVTQDNFAGNRVSADEARSPGEVFTKFDPILIMPVDRSPPGLVTAPADRVDPTIAVQSFRFPYFERFHRADAVARTFEARRARVEVRSTETGDLVLAESLRDAPDPEAPTVWPDWRPFEVFVTVSPTGRLSEPLMLGGGSGSDTVDRFMREHIRRRMRLDLRLSPGDYRIVVGP